MFFIKLHVYIYSEKKSILFYQSKTLTFMFLPQNVGTTSYRCVCQSGYSGQNCDTNVNECASNPCQNGGSCMDRVNGYQCQCSDSYTGSNCEVEQQCKSLKHLLSLYSFVFFCGPYRKLYLLPNEFCIINIFQQPL